MKPKLETKVLTKGRILLRPLDRSDASFVLKLRSDSFNMRFVNMKLYENIEQAIKFIDAVSNDVAIGSVCFWGICLLETKETIGTVCLWNANEDNNSVEIGYELLPDYQGYGYMRDTVSMVIDYAFTSLGIDKIEAVTHKNHNASLSLLTHFNFKYQGFIKQIYPESQDGPDMVLYCLTYSETTSPNQFQNVY
ncbi:MAG: GNAT family N-acetyltransferase [Dethiosulfatibacter sp.]|nr:GNAT family N-acetyltransferase [Dethiosulfatibacter sp.]